MKIVFLGDSITNGFHELKQHSYVVNMGKNGDRTTDIIERLADVKKENPDRLILMVGINDIMTNNNIYFNDLPISIETTYRFIVRYLVNNLDTDDITLLSVLPIASLELIDKNMEGPLNREIDELNQLIARIAKEFNIQYYDLNQYFKEDNRMKHEYTTDGIHLTNEGYAIFYEKIKNFLK